MEEKIGSQYKGSLNTPTQLISIVVNMVQHSQKTDVVRRVNEERKKYEKTISIQKPR